MATIDIRQIIDTIIQANGEPEPGDPPDPVAKIVEYTTVEGKQVWGIVFESERNRPEIYNRYQTPTEYVRNPKVIWRRRQGHG